jgi:DNA-binding PadR family transcriptional regulator
MKHAVLGLLVERRGYGHELVARLEDRLGPGFTVPPGTVYTSLETLERAGHIREVRRVMRGRQARVYFDATPDGTQNFAEWLEEPPVREPMRGELFLRLAMADPQHLPTLREGLERLELECLAAMAQHTRSRDLVDELSDPVPWATAARWLLDSGTLDRLNGDLNWIKRALGVLGDAQANGTVARAKLMEAVPSSG